MSTGFVITNLGGKLKHLSDLINQHLINKLYIYVAVNKNYSKLKNNECLFKRIIEMYSSSSSLFPNLDVRIILNDLKFYDFTLEVQTYNADVIILPKNYEWNNVKNAENLTKNFRIVYTDDVMTDEIDKVLVSKKSKNWTIYQNVVLGGTFDRLHNGHKILLTEALLKCSKKITVGVTNEAMTKGKILPELIEPCAKRITAVEKFIREVDRGIKYEVVEISDMYGPTKNDPNFNMIVVSAETYKGALKINEIRKKNNLNELDIHVVELVEDNFCNDVEEKKISSSNTRIRLLGCYLKQPQPTVDLPSRPYIIGLTGGVASGKSSICEYLSTLGAGTIDCDKVGHQLYKPQTDIYKKLINLFGEKILAPNKEINRKELGYIVFNNPDKLKQLNELMWPAIYDYAIRESQRLYKEENKEIVFLEAAVLIKADWHKKVHEVWSVIIPENEAISRMVKRNNFTEDEAKLRINAQSTNYEFVENSNVVFCSLWSYDFTRQQVNKAWKSVQTLVKSNL